MSYLVLHGRRSLQVMTDRLVVPAQEVESLASAAELAQSLKSLLDDEQRRIDKAEVDGHRAGHEAGVRQGHAEVRAEFGEAMARLVQERRAAQEAARAAVSTLALAVVKKLAASLGADHMVPALVEQAVLGLLPDPATRVRVHPDVVADVREHLARIDFQAEVLGDETLGAYDCVLEDDKGRSLVGLEPQLAVIATALAASAPALEAA
jgi:flagellar biosynthesis/type III secretory pathway protein FliH